MTPLSIQVPFPVFQDRDGQPLDNGYVWIGEPNLNPQTNPVVAYFDKDLTIPAAQPLRTINGYVSRAGTPAQIYVDGADFSILVQDNKGTMVYNFPDGSGIGADACGLTYNPPFTGAVPTPVCVKLAETVSVKDFGAVGDGVTDDTAAIQNALNAAQNKTLLFVGNETYKYSQLTIRSNTNLVTCGCVFNRIVASSSAGITVSAGVQIDSLIVSTPGGSGGDKAVRIAGGNVRIGRLSVTAAEEGVFNSVNWALEIGSNPAGTQLQNIEIGYLQTVRMSTAMFASYVNGLRVGRSAVQYYRTAYYLKDVSNSQIDNVDCEFLGAAVDGRPGENGLLIESSIASGSSHDLTFNGWSVKNAGEHSYRLGGQLTIRNVWFNGCTSEKSGSAILGGRTTSGEWHGGCGWKILGGNTTTTEFHENIFFDNCGVVDCSVQYGTYPTGHGVNNFQPWLVVMGKNVHLNSCWTRAKNQAFVSRYGILATASDGVYLNDCNFKAINLVPLRPYEETPVSGYPGSDQALTNFYVNGGTFEIQTPTAGSGLGLFFQQNAKYNHKNWSMDGVTITGGAGAVRIETVSTGSFENLNFDFRYHSSNVNETTYTSPVVVGAVYALVKATAPWRDAAFTPAALNGSTWTSPNDGLIRNRRDGSWRTESASTTYRVIIPNDGVVTVEPPAADTGHIFVTGDGTATHLMGWYRATSSPASSKYAGAATTAMVNTVLTGTTGTVGNVTVGVQDGLIYVENRNGAQNTFKVSFVP